MDAEVFLINISPRNWQACFAKKIFGTPVNAIHQRVQPGDIFLVRHTTEAPKGCLAIWKLESEERVRADTEIPWDDRLYAWKQHFTELVHFKSVFSEDFAGVSRYSKKTGLSAGRIIGAMVHLTVEERSRYISALLTEKSAEIMQPVADTLRGLIQVNYLVPKEAFQHQNKVAEGDSMQPPSAARNLALADMTPLRIGEDDVIYVGGTRVTLDTLIAAFEDGAAPEEIALQYPTLDLADIYAAIGFYLRQREDIAEYLKEREAQSLQVRHVNESRFSPRGIRQRLLARKSH